MAAIVKRYYKEVPGLIMELIQCFCCNRFLISCIFMGIDGTQLFEYILSTFVWIYKRVGEFCSPFAGNWFQFFQKDSQFGECGIFPVNCIGWRYRQIDTNTNIYVQLVGDNPWVERNNIFPHITILLLSKITILLILHYDSIQYFYQRWSWYSDPGTVALNSSSLFHKILKRNR